MGSDGLAVDVQNNNHHTLDNVLPKQHKVVENPHRQAVAELATMCSVPMALRAAIELNVPEILARAGAGEEVGALSSEEIIGFMSGKCLKAANLDRIMRLLSSRGIFSESITETGEGIERRYGLTPISEFLVKDGDGVSLAPLILLQTDGIFIESWQHLQDAVLEGAEPFTKAHGKTAFQYGTDDPRVNALFNTAMGNHSRIYMKAVLDEYDGFKNVRKLVDVGGGVGASLRQIVAKNPGIQGINFDQPHVVKHALEIPGTEHVGGNMFESVPSGDCIFMKWILHDWDDERCLTILKNCYKALPKYGKLVIADAVLPTTVAETKGARHGFTIDLLMMSYNSGGKERSEPEFRKLILEAGFEKFNLVLTLDSLTLMEAYKCG